MTRECHVRFCARLRGRFLGSTRLSNTASGAKASAILYPIIETAKANGLNPVKYVEHLLTEIPKRNAGDALEDLMPWVVRLGGDD